MRKREHDAGPGAIVRDQDDVAARIARFVKEALQEHAADADKLLDAAGYEAVANG